MPFNSYIDKRIVIDEYLKEYYCNKYPVDPKKVAVIYNGLDKKTLSYKQADKTSPLPPLPKKSKVITFIGRLESDKSPLRLVAIAKTLKEQSINACILVVGDGTLMKPMLEQAETLGLLNTFIVFYGSSQEPLPLMASSDFTVLVSNAEGVPMSVLESMSVHTPAIASSVGGIPEIIDSGLDGFLVDIARLTTEQEKIELFVTAIKEAINLSDEEKNTMKLEARNKIETQFASMSEIYQELFDYGTIKGL